MATATVKFQYTFNMPNGMTLNEALRLVTDNLGYKPVSEEGKANPETRKQFLSRLMGGQLMDKIQSQLKIEADASTAATLAAAAQIGIVSVDV